MVVIQKLDGVTSLMLCFVEVFRSYNILTSLIFLDRESLLVDFRAIATLSHALFFIKLMMTIAIHPDQRLYYQSL